MTMARFLQQSIHTQREEKRRVGELEIERNKEMGAGNALDKVVKTFD